MTRICVSFIWAILLCSAIVFKGSTSYAGEVTTNFGGVSLVIPYPDGLCRLGASDTEETLRRYMREVQKEAGNKLLAIFIKCDTKNQLINGNGTDYLGEYTLVVANNSYGDERVYPELNQESFHKMITTAVQNVTFDHHDINKKLSNANESILGDPDLIQIGGFINLGVLSETESIHIGAISNLYDNFNDEKLLLGMVATASLIKGVVINFYHYNDYKNENTIKELLSAAEFYSAKTFYLNKFQ